MADTATAITAGDVNDGNSKNNTIDDKKSDGGVGGTRNEGDNASLSSTSEGSDDAILPRGQIDPVYEEKARILNRAIQEIGIGPYQYALFLVVGFGWASDNLWPIATSLILPPIALEFLPSRPAYLTLAQNIGLLAGAIFWGFGCDIFGRKWAFNLTLGITAVFGMVAAALPNFASIGVFASLWSFGWLLTVLSVDWAVAQVVATLIAWPLGWRWFVITLGGLTLGMFLLRFAAFKMYESPKFLMGQGRDEEAVRVVHEVARRNGRECGLTVEDLKRVEPEGYVARTDVKVAVRRRLENVKLERVRVLFSTRKLAWSTGLIMAVWAFIGLGYPLYNAFLPYIQATRGADFGDGSTYLTYRNSLIIAAVGVPGALLGGYLVELPHFGRKGTLSLSTILTGVFLYCSTTALDSQSLLGWNCAFNFTSNVMYAVLYSFTPELFPTPQRGTGNALTATCNRIFGIMAPIVAMFADLRTAAPVYTSGALFIAAGVLVLLLPFESRGKAAL
ncbi:major facilitator superfamily domain-containing protein [Apiosordaria backusii]|uniref:Major facilitator superfamily domain-containing protein n=1 Tax=Apiosordaria backusii TaxID=314023 RepID=A0AA40EYN8_9PEZI|nr:major facilitator superfamily domain-containing protein [Apiosordaria backusii]